MVEKFDEIIIVNGEINCILKPKLDGLIQEKSKLVNKIETIYRSKIADNLYIKKVWN